jgi:Ca2+-dependent lipid-binding protein
MNSSGG